MDEVTEKLLSEDEVSEEGTLIEQTIIDRTSKSKSTRFIRNGLLALISFVTLQALVLYLFVSTSQIRPCQRPELGYPACMNLQDPQTVMD